MHLAKYQRKRKRRITAVFSDARFLNALANTLAVVSVAVLILAGLVWVAKRPYFNISQISIQSADKTNLGFVSPATVRATIAGGLAGNFFFMDLNEARQLIETTPWVRKAGVRRVWPNALLVSIEE